jgi:hypothetical protein
LLEKPNKAIVYTNELEILLDFISKRDVKIGDGVAKDDIAGVIGLRFNNVSVPNDNGIIFYFSVGWRRGLFFDFRPNSSDEKLENLSRLLGIFYETLLFPEIYALNKDVLDKLYDTGWFPFISLPVDMLEPLILRIAEGRSTARTESNLIEHYNTSELTKLTEKFRKQTFLEHHILVLEKGIENYLQGDYISSINNIWPRIEGILRFAYTGNKKRPYQDDLLENLRDLVANRSVSPSVFFPDRFRDYLLRYYFKNFDVPKGILDVSRHSIGHGVSDTTTYDRKRALLGILMIDQLTYYLRLRQTPPPTRSSP